MSTQEERLESFEQSLDAEIKGVQSCRGVTWCRGRSDLCTAFRTADSGGKMFEASRESLRLLLPCGL